MSQADKKNMGIDLDDFLEFYLLDSQEQIEKLGSGLLELERDGENISLVNDLFRSAHSLKGASGTMGFTPIVELTHAAEDLLDKLRQGKMLVTNEIIDVLLAVTDKVKMMLAQVGQRLAISVDYGDLTSQMKTITETGALAQESKPFAGKNQAEEKEDKPGVAFALSPEETGTVREAAFASKSVYRLNVVLEPNTMMKAVRAVMTIQRLELLGNVVKIIPSIDELEVSDALEFNMLFVTNESQEDIRADILEISEIFDVRVMNYTLPESDVNPIRTEKNVEEPASMSRSKQANQPVEQNNEQPQKDVNQVHTIRVDTARMDNLINLVGEMVITRTRLVKIGQDLQTENQSDPLVSNLNEANVYLGRLMNDLQESVMRLRMVPIGTIFSRYPRLVRDFCRKTGKRIELVIHGEETELDKIVIEMIGDPLTHIIRNSVDHGIEPPEERLTVGKPEAGTITLDAYHEGNHIAIIVSDDGAGLNLDKIYKKAVEKGLISEREGLSENDIANLIFLPGFSTADQITDISGRGVGMDVVKKAITNLGGIVDIKTSRGAGTSMIIRLPLTLAIIQALLVEVGNETYAVPLSSVVETLLVNKCDIKSVGSLPMVQLRGNTLPLISLKQKFDLPESAAIHDEVYVVVVGLGDKTVGLIVDELQGQQEVVIKSLGDYLNGLPGIAGATILGDGKVTLILDIGSLLQDILIKH
ncbi:MULTISPECIES: chemotaxis protein CheA [Dehalobacter]|jgi:two-component system chemotaxis sensor kinase CheA|uniref:Chemotaxis protein CheA n=2 Tax=Dehalobacter restrictus TaxID=55583 RepID=A0ABM5P7P6_DEHRP|nr:MULTISPECIES: chemotaxis protein CheA [Dehalobacter]AHF10625.1 chemotaxis protein [Dehalobacter restrictus DSM 9455]MDJ0306009.1 chemotaxis protein CheA [Dehalobacter sp.]